MHTSHYKWTPHPSQPLIPSYIPKGLGISYTESLWRTNNMVGERERDNMRIEPGPTLAWGHLN